MLCLSGRARRRSTRFKIRNATYERSGRLWTEYIGRFRGLDEVELTSLATWCGVDFLGALFLMNIFVMVRFDTEVWFLYNILVGVRQKNGGKGGHWQEGIHWCSGSGLDFFVSFGSPPLAIRLCGVDAEAKPMWGGG